MKLLMVLTPHDQLENTGKKTGFWLEEFAAPYCAFKDTGVDITLASSRDGQPPLDPKATRPTPRSKPPGATRPTVRPGWLWIVVACYQALQARASTPFFTLTVRSPVGLRR